MESKLHSFLEEATQELLYNIVYSKGNDESIHYRELSDFFEEKYGYRPMAYFGLRDTEDGWIRFLKSSHGLCLIKQKVLISKDESGNNAIAYEKFNKTKIDLAGKLSGITVAAYREIFIREACKLVTRQSQQTDEASNNTDDNGNTALHLIAALPCMDHEPTLIKHLLDAGFSPLQKNNDGQTIMHIIAGRMKVELIRLDPLDPLNQSFRLGYGSFRNVESSRWPADERTVLLQHLSTELSPMALTVLANTANNKGNTPMHEWVFSASTITPNSLQLGFEMEEKEIGLKLLSFGADLRQQNNSGEIPLHFAYNAELFQFLLEKSEQKITACCRARNSRDETPFLCILKYAAKLAFTEAADREMFTSMLILSQLLDLVVENKDICETVWLPDADGNSAVEIILSCIRKASYTSTKPSEAWFNIFGKKPAENEGHMLDLRKDLVKLLSRCLCVTNEYDLKTRNLLHALFAVDDGSKFINDKELLESIEILLQHDAVVNAVDSKGRTPLDLVKENESKNDNLTPFFKKCEKTLLKRGARTGVSMRSSAEQKALAPKGNADSKVRKLLSCPEKHKKSAKQLMDKKNVIVVKNYRYSSEDPIGLGAFSSIFVAIKDEHEDDKSGKTNCKAYALKRMEKARMKEKEMKREIDTLLFISENCENIIKCHETFKDESFQYMCLELMDGDLNEFFTDKKAISDFRANPVMAVKGIVNGLAYLHKKNFIHRDLKPGNILYTSDPSLQFKIADFGLTKNEFSFSTMTSTIGSGFAMASGTRCWMAPELVTTQSKHTKESDIFSLGLVFHFLLTFGNHPFASRNDEEPYLIENRIAHWQIKIDSTLHPEATSFLGVLMAKHPTKRPPADCITQHPFLWTEKQKIEFLEAVGNQPEAANPGNHPLSELEKRLQRTTVGKQVEGSSWDQDMDVKKLLTEMKKVGRKNYRTDKVIDLIRFIRNAYAHKQERSSELQILLKFEKNIFLRKYPTLVVDVFDVVILMNLRLDLLLPIATRPN